MQEVNQSLAPGTLVGHYQIEERLGEGGFGMTYRAQDLQLQRRVAIKEFIPVEFALRSQNDTRVQPRSQFGEQFRYGLDRFLDEARALARFDHVNIVRVYGFVEANDTAYLVMAYEQGETLADCLRRTGPLAEPELVEIVQSVFRGLKEVHRHNYLHRDIKPSNVYLRERGEAVLIDFGAARQALGNYTRSLTGIVSPGYAPSEQYGNDPEKQGPWTDLYAVGATLYRCISGHSPVDATSRLYALMEGKKDPLAPAVEIGAGVYSEKLLRLTDWLLSPVGGNRPQSVDAVFEWLEAEPDSPPDPKTAPFADTIAATRVISQTPESPAPDAMDRRDRGPDAGQRADGSGLGAKKSAVRDTDGASLGWRRVWWGLAGLAVAGILGYGLTWLFRPAAVKPGTLFVRAEPADAKVSFRDEKHVYRPGMELEAGSYALEISREGYRPEALVVAVEGGRVYRAEVNLERVAREKAREPEVKRPPKVAILPEMVRIGKGCFEMGSPEDEAGRSAAERLHRVCVGPFALGKYEVTVKEFNQFIEATAYRTDAEKGIGGRGCYGLAERAGQSGWSLRADADWREPGQAGAAGDDLPVTCVSWNDANAYIRWLNRESGKDYRLPTEAEWEYAARAGERRAAFWGNDPGKTCDFANAADRDGAERLSGWTLNACSDRHAGPAPVGRYAQNRFGLHDTAGNVWEWTCSGVDLAYRGGEQSCEPFPGAWHILRGGSWADAQETLRLAYRGRNASAFRSDHLGFRLAR